MKEDYKDRLSILIGLRFSEIKKEFICNNDCTADLLLSEVKANLNRVLSMENLNKKNEK